DSATFVIPATSQSRDGVGLPTYRLAVTVEQPGEPPYTGPFAAGYDVLVAPSINEIRQGGNLFRTEAKAELDAGGLVRSIVWKRADLTVRLVDQDGVEDTTAQFVVPKAGTVGSVGIGATTLRLTVTVEQPGEPQYLGTYSSGYDATVSPSINGHVQGSGLYR